MQPHTVDGCFSAVHSEQALAHARQLEEEKRRVQESYNDMQAVESVRVTAHDCLDVCGSTLLLPRLMP